MSDLQRGLFEILVTRALEEKLGRLDPLLAAKTSGLRPPEVPDRLGLHLSIALRRALAQVPERERVTVGIDLARQLVAAIDTALSSSDAAADTPVSPGSVLHAIAPIRPDGTPETIPTPNIPLLDTTLLTNARGEPNVGSQLRAEIPSADRIDLVMAFIRRSGIRPLLDVLRRHCAAGRPLRVLTTTYTNSTEARALDELAALGADVRVSYATDSTRLHAKAWLFHRDSGFSTAYIGSSNLTHSAQVTGLEWNVRASGARNPDVIEKVAAVFESYWQSGDFVPYDPAAFAESVARAERPGPQVLLSPVELRPEPFQDRLLEQIQLARTQGHHRNLLVAATGTGKTVMAALDYLRLQSSLPRARLLFVAHRKEILHQSRATFCHALRDPSFGELWVDGARPTHFEHVFASIQSLHAADLRHLDPRAFDIVIVDEFHHAAARSYTALLEHLQPTELLGLTATPERGDGQPILHWFDDRIAAELRLWDAIDQRYLTPFLYYGIHDGLDLRDIPWKRGRGYDTDGLTNLYTGNDIWARLVLSQLLDHADSPSTMRVLGFCVSVAHARFMARLFSAHGVPSLAVHGDTSAEDRRAALTDLAAGKIRVLFSVDLFNEGVDLPTVDTLLLLRPTDSATLFLQQLGRGLRKSPGKSACTVLDFVGHHRTEFRFDRRMRALLGGTRSELAAQVQDHFPFLPAGCHMDLDPVATEIVLKSIRSAVPTRWAAKADELRHLAASSPDSDATLSHFLTESGLDLEDLYAGGHSWSDLRATAGLPLAPSGPDESTLRRACGRLLHVDDIQRIDGTRRLLSLPDPPAPDSLPTPARRLLRMLVASLTDKAVSKTTSLADGTHLLWRHPQVRAELLALLDVLESRITHVHTPLPTHPDAPLQIHARYTRLEILAAFGIGKGAKVAPWQTGVRFSPEAQSDLFAFTLDKTTGQFSPTTRYRDYAISRTLIHWESQSATRADSETGQRYQHHATNGTTILLFARLRTTDRAFWCLGPATYVEHHGERPMAITWELTHPLPGDLFASFAAAVA